MKFLDRTWNKVFPIYDSTVNHPLILELSKSNFDESLVSGYLSQTSSLLDELSKIVSLILAKASFSSMIAELLRSAMKELENEKQVIDSRLSDIEDHKKKKFSPCYSYISYINFLIARAATEDIPVAVSIILPRFLFCHHFALNLSGSDRSLEWLKIYGSGSFSNFIKKIDNILNEMAEDQPPIIVQNMEEAFIHSSLFQWHLFQDVYLLRS